MFSRNYLLLLAAVAMVLGACARPLVNANRNKGKSGLSDVTITFANTLPPELRKRLTHYRISILPSASDAKCLAKKDVKKVEEKTAEWEVGKNLVIAESLTMTCVYLAKLEFGEMNEISGAKSFASYFSNFTDKDGDLIETKTAKVEADITVLITKDGIKEGLDKFTDDITSVTESDLSISVVFGGSKLNGTYEQKCEFISPIGKWFKRDMTINGTGFTVRDQFYDKEGCDQTELFSEETTVATFKLAKRQGDSNPIDITLTSKSFNAGPKFVGAHCGASDFVKGVPKDVLSLAECKTSAGPFALFDIIDLKNDALIVGVKDASLDGSTADKRPKALATVGLAKNK